MLEPDDRVAPPAPRPHLGVRPIARRLLRARLGTAQLTGMGEEVREVLRERNIDGAGIRGVDGFYLCHRDAGGVGHGARRE